jgi:hypothetical protein
MKRAPVSALPQYRDGSGNGSGGNGGNGSNVYTKSINTIL